MMASSDETRTLADPHEWVARHGDYLYRFVFARTRQAEASEEIVQETLLAAWKGRARFSGASSERTWLSGIAKRKVIDWLRKRVRDRVPPSSDAEPDPFMDGLFTADGHWKNSPGRWNDADPSGPAERAEFWAVMRDCVGHLPTRLRDVFTLRYLDEAEGEEVCRAMGLTPANFWVMLHRARLRMWWCLSRNWFGEEPRIEGHGS